MGAGCAQCSGLTCCSTDKQLEDDTSSSNVRITEVTQRLVPESLRSSRRDSGRIDQVYQLDLGRDGILGHSSIGFIVKAGHRDSRTVRAVKQISKRSIEGSGWKEDIQTISGLDHPHICKLHETWEDAMHVYLIMELCKGGQLTSISANQAQINESTIAALVWQMSGAVSALHEHKVYHSDVRLENWMFSEPVLPNTPRSIMSLKMIDFGIAQKFRHNRSKRNSREFEAREVLAGLKASSAVTQSAVKGKPVAEEERRLSLTTERTLFCKSPEQLGLGCGETSEKVDVWALGVIAYFLLSGQPPFGSDRQSTDAALFRSATFVFMPPELWRPISSEAKNFIAMCLQKDPENRPAAHKVLSLPWMSIAKRAAGDLSGNGTISRPPSKPLNGAGVGLAASDPALPSAKRTAKNLARMSRLHVFEKAAIIAAAHRLTGSGIEELKQNLLDRDKLREGCVSIHLLFEALEQAGVPCTDLAKLVKDMDSAGVVTIEYDIFCTDVAEFQQNLQDSAAWAVFRSFETNGDLPHNVSKKDLTLILGQDGLRQGIADNYPELAMDSVLQDLDHDAAGVIDFEGFKGILRGGSTRRLSEVQKQNGTPLG